MNKTELHKALVYYVIGWFAVELGNNSMSFRQEVIAQAAAKYNLLPLLIQTTTANHAITY